MLEISTILGGIGQFTIALIALIISIFAFFSKRKDIFRTEITRAQFEEIGKIRMDLHQIWFDFCMTYQFAKSVGKKNINLKEMRNDMPEQWKQFESYKSLSITTFNKFSMGNYYLFPKWIDKKKISQHYDLMHKFMPFTASSIINKNDEEFQNYADSIVELIGYLDNALIENT